jgi:hypothetical protein
MRRASGGPFKSAACRQHEAKSTLMVCEYFLPARRRDRAAPDSPLGSGWSCSRRADALSVSELERSVLAEGVALRYGQSYGPGIYHEQQPPKEPRVHIDRATERGGGPRRADGCHCHCRLSAR